MKFKIKKDRRNRLRYFKFEKAFIFFKSLIQNKVCKKSLLVYTKRRLWFISKGRWIGFGDAKLAIPLAFMLGVPEVYSFVVLSFWIGAILSLALLLALYIRHQVKKASLYNKLSRAKMGNYTKPAIALYSKSFTMKSEIPFAPFMVVAFLVVYLYEVNVLSLIATFI